MVEHVGTAVDEVAERKRQARAEGIDRLQAEARERGQVADRAFWSMVWDLEMAPLTTNRKQLAEIGVDAPEATALADDELALKLREVVLGLARLHVYLIHTEHLSDRELYGRLVQYVLEEDVRDVPSDGTSRDFVDMSIECPMDSEGDDDDGEIVGRPVYDREAWLPRPPD